MIYFDDIFITILTLYSNRRPNLTSYCVCLIKGENDFLNYKTIDSVPPSPPTRREGSSVAQISKNYCPGKELRQSKKNIEPFCYTL